MEEKSGSQDSKSPSQLIDARIEELGDWRGELLSRLRSLVKEADPEVVEEWKIGRVRSTALARRNRSSTRTRSR